MCGMAPRTGGQRGMAAEPAVRPLARPAPSAGMSSKRIGTLGVVHHAAVELDRRGLTYAPLAVPQPAVRSPRGRVRHAPGCGKVAGRTNLVHENVALPDLLEHDLCGQCHHMLATGIERSLLLADKVISLAERTEQWERGVAADPSLFTPADVEQLRERADALVGGFERVDAEDQWAEWKVFARTCGTRLAAVAEQLAAHAAHGARLRLQRAALDVISSGRHTSSTRSLAPAGDYPCALVGDGPLTQSDLLNHTWSKFYSAAQDATPEQAADSVRGRLDLSAWTLPSLEHIPPVPVQAGPDLRAAVDQVWREAAHAALLDALDAWVGALNAAMSAPDTTMWLSGLKNPPVPSDKRMLSLLEVRDLGAASVLVYGNATVVEWLRRFAATTSGTRLLEAAQLSPVPADTLTAVLDTATAILGRPGGGRQHADEVARVWDAAAAAVAA